MLTYVIAGFVTFLAGYIFHAAITKYLKADESKAESEAKALVTDADQEVKKL